MSILETVNSPEDLRGLSENELMQLCGEIRSFLIDHVSKTGGHLSSNLGAVELTVAIHRVYDTSRDRVVFDVGHQSYVHKLLTGRRDRFDTLRAFGGMAGFPKPCESVDDAFVTGHASTSVSVALGMARARTEQGAHYDVCAVIGDGALTGGLAYEGLCDAGSSAEPLVVILNDNGMSIDKNVGGAARLLSRSRMRPGYLRFKRTFRNTLGRIRPLYLFAHRVKEGIKRLILHTGMFDDLGFEYYGPVDGHDVRQLESALRWAREQEKPVLVHVVTQKGRGYGPAEESPELYHGVGPFDPQKGIPASGKSDFSSVFGETLCSLAQEDRRVNAITAAMTSGTGLAAFSERFPERFFDVGIAEGHAVAMAAGMAKQGAVPVCAIYSSFLQRSYDMLLQDVALQRLHVVLGVDRAGLVGQDGETHHGVFDVNYLTSVPHMAVFCPASYAELREMLRLAVERVSGPAALRYPRGGEGEYRDNHANEPFTILRDGGDVCLICYGTMVNNCLEASRLLEGQGLRVRLIKLNLISPLDEAKLAELASGCRAVVIAEEVCDTGCVGRRILSAAALRGEAFPPAALVNLGSGIVTHGETKQLYASVGLDAASLAARAAGLLRPGAEEGSP